MKISVSWLKQLVETNLSAAEIAHTLTMAGLEVEEMASVAPPFTGVVVGEIKSATQHPNADKLRVCEVDAGTGSLLQIVCGAPNAAAGMKVPCALVGAKLPGIEIKNAKLRGVESFGMLCSADELGMPQDHDGLLPLPADAPVGQNIRDYLGLDDVMLTLKLTPNRGDCLGMDGVARDFAAVLRVPFKSRSIGPVKATIADALTVDVQSADLCGRFSGRVVRGVNTKAATPAWMRQRLERFGQRSISPLVDISNYVMLELGRPSHIFDLDKVAGKLIVRWGQPGEAVELLNGQTVTVDETVGVIADEKQVEALAGVMGGQATAVSDTTQNVFIEAAFWWPDAIAGRARRYGFATDAAHRFERGTDFATTALHVEYITQLVLDICGGEAGPLVDQTVKLPARPAVLVRPAYVTKLIGTHVDASEIRAMFERLNCAVTQVQGGFSVTPPSYRFDLNIEEDFVEEVARIHGFDNVPPVLTRATTVIIPEGEGARTRRTLRRHMVDMGYQEVINYAFIDEAWERDLAANLTPVRLANPIASQLNVMRTQLFGGLLATLTGNINRGADRARLFEVGRCFLSDNADMAEQPEKIAGLAFGRRHPEQWGEGKDWVDFFAVKGEVEALMAPLKCEFRKASHPALHPGRTAEVLLDGHIIGVVGELHPKWQQQYELASAPVLFELLTQPLMSIPAPRFSGASKMQPVRRDLAILVDDGVVVGDIVKSVSADLPEVVKSFELFDIYRGSQVPAGKKSLAFLILMQHNSRTLTDSDADAAAAQITQILTQKFAATLRA